MKPITIAAHNSSDADKAKADYVCTGRDDAGDINAVLAQLPSTALSGTVCSYTFPEGAIIKGTFFQCRVHGVTEHGCECFKAQSQGKSP